MTEHTKLKKGHKGVATVIAVCLIFAVIAVYLQDVQVTVVWKDNGHVSNFQQYPVPDNLGEHLQQRMTILTVSHGNIPFDTANMCARDIALGYSCSSGTVGWGNGTWVFIYHLSNGGNYVGELNP